MVAPCLMWTEAVLVVRYIPLRIQLRSGFKVWTRWARAAAARSIRRTQDGCLAAGFAVAPMAGGGVRWLLIVVGAEIRAGSHCVSWLQAAVAVERAHVGLGVARHGELRALCHLVSREPAVVAGDRLRAWGRVTLSGEPKLKAFRTPPGAWLHKWLWVRISVGDRTLLRYRA